MERKRYSTDMTDGQWQVLEPLIPPAKPGGRPRTVDMREVINGIFYVARSGCAWRLVPHDLPPWGTIWYYFRQWRLDGTWQKIHDALRSQTRVAAGREESPSAGILDSQSVKTTEKGGRGATTPGKRSPAANGTLSSTH